MLVRTFIRIIIAIIAVFWIVVMTGDKSTFPKWITIAIKILYVIGMVYLVYDGWRVDKKYKTK